MNARAIQLPAIAGAERSEDPAYAIDGDIRSQNMVAVGNTGSGKSSVARAAYVEPLLEAHRRVNIIDPTGVWWGLRFMADGSPGYAVVILGGLYGDAPLSKYDGRAAAQFVGAFDGAVIIDLSELLIGQRQEFATDYFEELFRANKRPLHLIVDEADEFAPQNPMPDTRRLFHHFDRIVRRGRTRGFRVAMVTQRPAVLHKSVMNQARVLIALQLLGTQDREAVRQWVSATGDSARGKEVIEALPSLSPGEGFVWAPGAGRLVWGKFRMFRTFDSSRTPKDDEQLVEPPGLFPFDIRPALLGYHHQADEEEEETKPEKPPKASTAKGKALPKACAPPAPTITVEQLRSASETARRQGFDTGYAAATAAIGGKVHGVLQAADSFLQELKGVSAVIGVPPQSASEPAGDAQQDPAPKRRAKADRQAPAGALAAVDVQKDGLVLARGDGQAYQLSKLATKLLLGALCHPEGLTWFEMSIEAGVTYGNGDFAKAKRSLLEEGFIEDDAEAGLARPSKKASKLLGHGAQRTTRRQYVERLTHRAEQRVMQWLIEHPEPIAGKDLAARIGITYGNGDWARTLRTLATRGYIWRTSGKRALVRLSDFLLSAPAG